MRVRNRDPFIEDNSPRDSFQKAQGTEPESNFLLIAFAVSLE